MGLGLATSGVSVVVGLLAVLSPYVAQIEMMRFSERAVLPLGPVCSDLLRFVFCLWCR